MSERRKEGGYSAHHLYFRMILFESAKNALSYYLSFSVALLWSQMATARKWLSSKRVSNSWWFTVILEM